MKKYMSADDYIQVPGEKNCGTVKIEKLGYVSPKRQIEALFYSGGQFVPPAKEEYDYGTLQECDEDNGSDMPIRDADLIDVAKLSEYATQELVRGGIRDNKSPGADSVSNNDLTDNKENSTSAQADSNA